MKIIILLGALAVLAGCGGRHPARGVVDPPRPQIIRDPAPEPPIPRKTVAVARISPREAPTPEIRTEAKVERPDLAGTITETNARLLDIYFDYDRDDLTSEGLSAVQKDAKVLAPILSDFVGLSVSIEGHCDERGSAEYNLALGDIRARRVAEMLRNPGLASGKLQTVSYGKEKPQCVEPAESCWQRNRRAHIVVSEGEGRAR